MKFKTLFVALSLSAITPTLYASDYNKIADVANKYMSSISTVKSPKPVKIINLSKNSTALSSDGFGNYAVIYSNIPTESSIGGNSNFGMQLVDVKEVPMFGYYVSVKNSTPIAEFSDWPIDKFISNTDNSMVVNISAYGPKDPESCMSLHYQETLVRSTNGNWIVKDKKFLGRSICQ